MPPWPVRLLAAGKEILGGDWKDTYQEMSLKLLFSCEHLCLVRQGMICSVSGAEETLEDLMNSL